MSHATTIINLHETDRDIYNTLARVFGTHKGDTSEWIVLDCEGVTVNFFKTPEPIEVVSEVS